MKRGDSDSQQYWEDDFDRKKKSRVSNKNSQYKRKQKYKNNYFNEDDY